MKTIKELVDKAYDGAKGMLEMLDKHNEESETKQGVKLALTHFGLEYTPYESPWLSREDFVEVEAQLMLRMILDRELHPEKFKDNKEDASN